MPQIIVNSFGEQVVVNDSPENADSLGICQMCGTALISHVNYRSNQSQICDDCYFSREPRMQNYSYKPRPVFHGKGKKMFGVEIECTTRGSADRRAEMLMLEESFGDMIYLKPDCSIETRGNQRGLEIVTHPMSLRYMHKYKVFDSLKDRKLASFNNPTTGIHVHVSREALSELTIAKILYFYAKPENKEFILKISQRYPNEYCKHNSGPDFDSGKNVNKPEQRGRYSRYVQINLCNEKTVEFRHFKGNVDPKAVYRAVEFVDAITKFCSKTATCDLTVEKFLEFLQDNSPGNIYNYRHGWRNLKKFIKKGRTLEGWKNVQMGASEGDDYDGE